MPIPISMGDSIYKENKTLNKTLQLVVVVGSSSQNFKCFFPQKSEFRVRVYFSNGLQPDPFNVNSTKSMMQTLD